MGKIIDPTNNFKVAYPNIAREWDYSKNRTNPEDYFSKSRFNAWWICSKCGRSYQMRICQRINGHQCNFCNGNISDKKTKNRILKSYSLVQTHSELVKEWNPAINNGLKPEDFSKGSNEIINWTCSKCSQIWSDSIYHRVSGRGCPFCKGTRAIKGVNDFATLYPELAKEWGPSNKNAPYDFAIHSSKKVYWLCPKCHHEYMISIRDRIKGCNCSICSSHKLIVGHNDFKTRYPEIAKDWDYEKNKPHKPEDFFPSSRTKVYWLCPKGHSYRTDIHNRINGVGCPKCDKERQTSFPEQALLFYLSKVTDAQNRIKINGFEVDVFLPTLKVGIEYDGIYFHSDAKSLIKEEKKNKALLEANVRLIRVKELKPKTMSYVDGDVIYYSMSNSSYGNFDWVINTILNMIGFEGINIDIQNDSIEIKSNYLTLVKENSIATKFPDLVKEWDYELNNNINPEFVSCNSNQNYYWKCPKCHQSYKATPSHRIRKNNGCPVCSNHQRVVGINDFGTTHKEELLDWDYLENKLTPQDITFGSEKKIHWKCHRCGFKWIEYPYRKIKKGCPECKRLEQRQLYGKRVMNIETGQIFETLHDASASVGKTSGVSPISDCCKGKRKSAYGYHWKFVK